MNKLRTGLMLVILSLVACGDPRAYYDAAIKSQNFIPYKLPMESTRVGTVVRGNANEMYPVARPEKCFPDFAGADSLRWTQSTVLPDQYRKIEFGFDVSANPILNAGSSTMNLKASAKYVKTVSLEFGGASIEFLDESNFMDYYSEAMSASCKSLLAQYPFIGTGLRVESMRFQFKDATDVAINLTMMLPQIVQISAGVQYHVENNYTLVIDTPKYIGYRLGKLSTGKNGKLEILYASAAGKNGVWNFRSVGTGVKSLKATSANEPKLIGAPQVAEPLSVLP